MQFTMAIAKLLRLLFVRFIDMKNKLNKNVLLSIFFIFAITLHALLFYLAIGPFNLFTDSAGYLSTADTALNGGGWIFNPNRPIGLPLFFFSLLKISHGHLGIITFLQITSLIGALFFSVYTTIPKLQLWKKLLATWIIILLSTRTFIYSYLILSETFFTTCLLFFLGFFFLYIQSTREKEPNKYSGILWGMFLAALFAAWIKSIGILLILLFILILIAHFIRHNRNYLQGIAIFAVLLGALGLNHACLGTYAFSKQDGIQWLISANEYINYDSPYMSHEKNLIRKSHQEILKRYTPRTRLDQIIGPLADIETPAQILQKDSANYDQFNEKIRNLIFEGLGNNNNWKKYLEGGAVELKKTIVDNTQEGLIIPLQLPNSNETIISWLPTLKSTANENVVLNKNPLAVNYYDIFIKWGILPKYIASLFLLSIFIIAAYLKVYWEDLAIIFTIFFLLTSYMFISVLLVFALDRYYTGIEMLIFVLIAYLLQLILNRKMHLRHQSK